ncbi:MAG: signal peptidase I [Actinomycetota bacterium]
MRPPLEESPLQSDWPDKPAGEPPKKRSALAFFKELPVLILIAFGLALLIKTFLIQAFFIPSESMVPTLEIGDRVLVNKLVYRFREPRRGEIIVFVAEHDQAADQRNFLRKIVDTLTEGLGVTTPGDRDFIKRIVGLPGETVEVKEGVVTVTKTDGSKLALKEPYLSEDKDPSAFGPFTVPPKSLFVMGDNRPNSADSRSTLGPIKRDDVVGKAFVKVWPPSRIGALSSPKYRAAALGAVVAPVVLLGAARRRRRQKLLRRRRSLDRAA